MELFEKDEYTNISIEKIEESEQVDLRKEELSKDEYEPEL